MGKIEGVKFKCAIEDLLKLVDETEKMNIIECTFDSIKTQKTLVGD